MSKPTKPQDLAAAGTALWDSISSDYDLRPDELTMLELACRARDRIAAMEAERGGRVTELGSTGQLVAHPLIAEIRQTEAQVSGLLAKLKLPDPVTGEKPNQQRDAANSRWANAHGTGA